jgi:hypothetical protein
MYSAILDPQKKLGKRIGTKMLSLNASAYVAVLTEHTLQIAPHEKDRSRTTRTTDAGFFPWVQRRTRHTDFVGRTAKAHRPTTIGSAFSGALHTCLHFVLLLFAIQPSFYIIHAFFVFVFA